MTRQARLGMNGPEVIEQEAGIEELDSRDRSLIWSMIGGEQRAAVGLVDTLVEDDTERSSRRCTRRVQTRRAGETSERTSRRTT